MNELNLQELVSELKTYQGIIRKHPIADVIKSFPKLADHASGVQILADFGEDAAVISLTSSVNGQNDGVLLLAADGIMATLMDADPYWAGYCAVLVNLNDIAAMGGLPLAMVDVLSAKDKTVQKKLATGMNEACTKFGVPIVGGHIHPNSEFNAIDIAVLGISKRSSVIYSHTAEIGDSIIFAMDLDGQLHHNARYAWDTTTHKSPALVRRQLLIMSELGNLRLIHAGKDISNPGTLGTLGMLLESSKKGAMVDLDAIPQPENIDFDFTHWLKVYQGCGFVITCYKKHEDEIIARFKTVGLTAKVAGKITQKRKLIIKQEDRSEVLFDFKKETITGI